MLLVGTERRNINGGTRMTAWSLGMRLFLLGKQRLRKVGWGERLGGATFPYS